MCLIVPKGLKPHIITEDKTVYKAFRVTDAGILLSAYQYTQYEIDKLYQTEIDYADDEYCAMSSTDSFRISEEFPNWTTGEGVDSVREGIHYINDIDDYKNSFHLEVIYECLIPKGSEIIESWGLGVTNQIIIKRKVD